MTFTRTDTAVVDPLLVVTVYAVVAADLLSLLQLGAVDSFFIINSPKSNEILFFYLI